MAGAIPVLLGLAGAVSLLTVADPASAQEAPARTAPAEGPDASTQIAALQQQILEAQQEIVRLRAEVSSKADLEAALAAAREKNARLVAIGNELIAAYARRYRRGTYLPFDTGRRKLEAELQDVGDRIYDNRVDAGPRRPLPAPNAESATGAEPQDPGTEPSRRPSGDR